MLEAIPEKPIKLEINASANSVLDLFELLTQAQAEMIEALKLDESRYWCEFEKNFTGVDMSLTLKNKGGGHA
jgi:hypothetical protein